MRCKKTLNKQKMNFARMLDIIAVGGVALVALLGVILMGSTTHAEDSLEDSLSLSISTSCVLYGTVDTPHTATIAPGIYTENIGQTTIKTICNDINGFAIYSVGYTDDTEGKTVLTSDAGTSYDIPTGTATSGTSNWAMKVNAVSGNTVPTITNSFDNYHAVPSSYTKVASYTGPTDSTAGASVTTTYAFYAETSQMTGIYTGKVKYVMVHPSTATGYTVVYDATGGTVSPSSEVVALGNSTTLPEPTQSGYEFLGWYTAATGGTKIGDAGDTYTPTTNTTMYAQWEEKPSNLFAISTMQEMTSEICANTTTPLASATNLDTDGSHAGDTSYVPSTTLTDTRGGSYVVRKYADGNCWMAQNLNLMLTAGSSLTNQNTDLNSQASWDPGTSTSSTVPSGASTTTSTSYTRGNKWCSGTAESTNQTCNTTDTGDQTNHVGILYNWYAATAGTGTSNLVSTDATNTTDAADSICPKGWQLPTGGTSNKTNGNNNLYSFYNLLQSGNAYNVPSSSAGSVTMRSAPLSFILSALYNNGSMGTEGSTGRYWSSSAYTSSSVAYYLYFGKSSVDPQDSGFKYLGFSVRCVAR